MSDHAVQQQSTKIGITLLEFVTGRNVKAYYRFCDDKADVYVGTDRYDATPTMLVPKFTRTGGLVEKDIEIDLPLRSGFLTDMSDGRKTPPIAVNIRELSRNEYGHTRIQTHWLGRSRWAIRNPSGKQAVVRFVVADRKSKPPIPLGICCTVECDAQFGGPGCYLNLAPFQLFATITGIQGNRITLDDFAGPTGPLRGKAAGWWVRGTLDYQEVHLDVKAWETGTVNFVLTEQPPPGWLNQLVRVTPGCDRLRSTCSTKYNNEANLQAHGIAIPSHNALYESPE